MTSPEELAETVGQINAAREQSYENIALTQAHVNQASQAASSAAQDRAIVQGLVQQSVTVDTTVGTRVFAGDVMIFGDTGWRNVVSLLESPWGTSHQSSHAKMRRTGDRVEFEAYITWDQEASANVGMTKVLKTIELNGFRPSVFQLRGMAYVLGQRSTLVIRSGTAADYLELSDTHLDRTTTLVNGERVYMRADWITFQSWPSSLPGTTA